MDLQKRYDELENIVDTITLLIQEIEDKNYIDQLREIKEQAEQEKDIIDKEMEEEKNKEDKELNRLYELSKL